MSIGRVIAAVGLAGLALLLQGLALLLLVFGPWPPEPRLAVFLLVQVLVSLSSAASLHGLLPLRMRHPAWKGLLANATTIFFLPVAGQVLIIGVLLFARWLPAHSRRLNTVVVGAPTFDSKLLDRVHPGGATRARAQASHSQVPVQERMAAMMAIRTAPLHLTSGLLQDLLGDTQDEVRLLAYGIRDRGEQHITQQIAAANKRLQQHAGMRRAGIDHAHLAELYWELIYQGLVPLEMQEYTLQHAIEHAQEALSIDPKLAGMHFLLGALMLYQYAPDAALEHFRASQQLGMSESRLASRISEALFMQRRFSEIPAWLSKFQAAYSGAQMQALERYWL